MQPNQPNQPNGAPPPQVEDWALISLPPMPPGVTPPAFACDFRVGLTKPDSAGHRWAVLIVADGTISTEVRIPVMLAIQVGQGLAAAMTKVQGQWEASGGGAKSKLVLPNGGAGGLFVAGPQVPPHGGVPRG